MKAVKAHLEDGQVYDVEYRHRHQSGEYRWQHSRGQAVFDEDGNPVRMVGCIRDITDRKRAEEGRESAIELLRLINAAGTSRELMKMAADFLKRLVGCDAVGIRLREGNDFPYYEVRGLSEDFVLAESRLCVLDEEGKSVRDKDGNLVLKCMCGTILSGRCDPSQPFFTEKGSFWTNGTTEFLAHTSEAERQGRTRNRCNAEGYESVALIPLRLGEETFGLVQFSDKRRGLYTPEMISLLEQHADQLAVALSHRLVEQALSEREAHQALILRTLPMGLFVAEASGEFGTKWVSDQIDRLSGFPPEVFVTDPAFWASRIHPGDRDRAFAEFAKLGEENAIATEYRWQCTDGIHRWFLDQRVLVRNDDGTPREITGTWLDITERKEAEDALRLDEARLEALLKLSEMPEAPFRETVDFTLAKSVEVTRSKIGFL